MIRSKWNYCELPKDAKLVPNTDRYFADPLGNIYRKYKNGRYIKMHTKIDKNNGYVSCSAGLIHRLVALTFIPNPENKREVNHKNGNKQDNSISNLEWATRKENVQHAYKTGLVDRGKLSEVHKRSLKVIFSDDSELVFNSVRECAHFLKVDDGDMSKYAQGKQKVPKRCNVKEVFYLVGNGGD